MSEGRKIIADFADQEAVWQFMRDQGLSLAFADVVPDDVPGAVMWRASSPSQPHLAFALRSWWTHLPKGEAK